MALILEAAKGEGASLSYAIKYAGTNYMQFKKYLVSLVEMGYVDVNTKKGQVLYRASEKGLAFLKQYYVLLGMLLGACKEDNRLTLSPKLNMYLIDKNAHQHALRHDS
jgi:predicted transcriptional regulator